MSEDEVREASFRADVGELGLVLRVHLQSQTHAQDKGCNARDEATEEGVEGERADEAAVDKLKHPGEEHVGEVGVDNLEFLGGVVDVLVRELGNDSQKSCRHR